MGIKKAYNNFTGGEISPTLSGRYDLSRFQHCARRMENFLPGLHGDVKRRPGTRYIGTLDGFSVLIPFRFSVEPEQNFVLIFSAGKMRVASESAMQAAEVATPYAAEDLYSLSYAQVGDVVYLAHEKSPLHKVERRGSPGAYTWDLVEVALNTSLRAPFKPTVAFREIKQTSPSVPEVPRDYTLRYKVVAVDKDGIPSLPSPAGEEPKGKFPTDWIAGEHCKVTWSPVDGAVEYNVYRENAGYYGFIGVVKAEDAKGGALDGIGMGSLTTGIIKYAGAITRHIVVANGAVTGFPPKPVEDKDETSPLSVTANQGQNAFLVNGKLLVWTTKMTNKDVWKYVTEYDPDSGAKLSRWTYDTTTTTERFWAMVDCPSGNPVGSYNSHVTGDVGSNPAYPDGTIGPFTVWPFYTAGTSLKFIDENYEADVSDTPREDWDPFKDGNNPATVSFHQQRMVLGGTKTEPQSFYMSRVGDFENFRKSRPLQEDDPVEYALASGSIDAIAWAASFGDLLIGTAGAEYKATGESGVVTAKSVKITSQSYWGSSPLAPIIVGNSILHVQRHGAKVRDLFYSLEKDGYSGNDLSIMAPHLFDGHTLKQWAYQQTPGSVIWVVRDDGLLLALTYLKEHDIWGWSRHPIDGDVVSVATISGKKSDVLMLVTRRAGKYYLERMVDEWADTEGIEDAYFVDCGLTMESEQPKTEWDGLGHLEGRKVSILAGGSPVEGLTVAGGKVEVPYPVTKISVGIPYVSVIEPMPVEADTEKGTTLGKLRGYAVCTLRLHRSVGGQYGADDSLLYDLPFVPDVWGEPCEPFSGDIVCNPNTPQRSETSLCVVQRRALPMHIVAMVLDIDFGEA